MRFGTWMRKVRDGFIQDDPNPEPSNLDRLDGLRPVRADTRSRALWHSGAELATGPNPAGAAGRDELDGRIWRSA
jgi:hypothetical protein